MKLLEINNELIVNDINKSIDFYKEYFDFKVVEEYGEPVNWVKMQKDECIIMFESYEQICEEIKGYPNNGKNSNLIMFKYEEKDSLLDMYYRFKNNNIKIFSKYNETDYGSVEFGVYDPDGNMILIQG